MISTQEYERRRRFLISAAYLAVIGGAVYLFFRYLLPLIGPFFIAYLFAWMLSPAIRWLTVRRHLKYDLAAALCLIFFFSVLGGAGVLLVSRLVALASEAVLRLPTLYADTIAPGLDALTAALETLARRLGHDAAALAEDVLPSVTSSIGAAAASASMGLVSALSGWLARLPGCLLSAVICVISTIFMTVDFPRMTAFLHRQIPEPARHAVREARDAFARIVRKYGRGYAVIMGITFLETAVGLILLRQKNAVAIALGIALFDIFPIVGAGTILLPWSVVCFLMARPEKGAGLLVIYLTEIVVRQCAEPRIVGRQVGLHPLVTLIAMFVGLKLFGGIGIPGLPVACAIAASLDAAGVLRLLRHEDAAPAEEDTLRPSSTHARKNNAKKPPGAIDNPGFE